MRQDLRCILLPGHKVAGTADTGTDTVPADLNLFTITLKGFRPFQACKHLCHRNMLAIVVSRSLPDTHQHAE